MSAADVCSAAFGSTTDESGNLSYGAVKIEFSNRFFFSFLKEEEKGGGEKKKKKREYSSAHLLHSGPCRQVVANLRRAAAENDEDGNADDGGGGGGLERVPSISEQANPYFTDHTPRMPANASRITFADEQLPTQQIPFKFPGRDV